MYRIIHDKNLIYYRFILERTSLSLNQMFSEKRISYFINMVNKILEDKYMKNSSSNI